MLTKIKNDSKKKADIKPTELGTKVQFKKTVDDMQKQIGLLYIYLFTIFTYIYLYINISDFNILVCTLLYF